MYTIHDFAFDVTDTESTLSLKHDKVQFSEDENAKMNLICTSTTFKSVFSEIRFRT